MKSIHTLSGLSVVSLALALASPVSAQQSYAVSDPAAACPVDPNWVKHPSMPTEVKKSGSDGSSNFCDFYQFSNQAFLYLMSQNSKGQRNFMDQAVYPVLEFDAQGNPADSCDNKVTGPTLRTSLDKGDSTSISTEQAGDGATIYAQDTNVVYYDVRFDKGLCSLSGSAVTLQQQNIINFPSGTTEMKSAWKLLSAAEVASNSFVTQPQTIGGQNVTLGLVGMHIAIATKDHPEFVWATYEHRVNSPDCMPATAQPASPWTFASASCTAGLPGTAISGNNCNFNNPPENKTEPTGTPTNICRVYPYGTATGDLKAAENVADITAQNRGVGALVSATDAPAGMQVLGNYFNVGALWVSDITQSSGGVGVPNERGSLRLANTVAETTFQDVDLQKGFASNCFGCHNYSGTGQKVSNNITSQNLSHLFLDVKIGQGQNVDVTAPTVISNNSAAAGICGGNGTSQNPGVCKNAGNNLKWNGNWTNANSSAGSVCGCTAQ